MAKLKRKGESGSATLYMTRERALRKLRLTLPQFRKLCILKGIYPRDPKRKLRNSKRTYYYAKDIRHMSHDPMIQNFRDHQVWLRRLRSARMKKLPERVKMLLENEPRCSLDYLVKERYPTFMDALRDLDDALIMIHLFAMMSGDIVSPDRIENCSRLCQEFQNYVIHTRSLRKVFISIKGIYFQARVMETDITWIVPHAFTYEKEEDVDYDVMLTFLSFYEVLMGFVNYRLYHTIGWRYPPKHDVEKDQSGRLRNAPSTGEATVATKSVDSSCSMERRGEEKLDTLPEVLANMEMSNDEEEVLEEEERFDQNHDDFKNLFSRYTFFLNREVSHGYMEFIIRCFGGSVFYQSTRPDLEDAQCITHQIVDRGKEVSNRRLDREYIQPQWVFDCINARKLLPTTPYGPTSCLPPHLSPFFVDECAEGVVDDSVSCRVESDQIEESSDEQELVYEKELLDERRVSEDAQMSLLEELKSRALEKRRAMTKEQQSLKQLRESMLPSKPRRLLRFIAKKRKLQNKYRKSVEDKAKMLSSKKLINSDGVLVKNCAFSNNQ